MGILDGGLADAVFKGFKGRLLSGVIRQVASPASGSLDDLGDPESGSPIDTACEGFVENYNSFFQAQAGIPKDSIRVLIFAKSCPNNTPGRDDLVRMGATWYQLRSIKTDPATALWDCEAFRIEAPQ